MSYASSLLSRPTNQDVHRIENTTSTNSKKKIFKTRGRRKLSNVAKANQRSKWNEKTNRYNRSLRNNRTCLPSQTTPDTNHLKLNDEFSECIDSSIFCSSDQRIIFHESTESSPKLKVKCKQSKKKNKLFVPKVVKDSNCHNR